MYKILLVVIVVDDNLQEKRGSIKKSEYWLENLFCGVGYVMCNLHLWL